MGVGRSVCTRGGEIGRGGPDLLVLFGPKGEVGEKCRGRNEE